MTWLSKFSLFWLPTKRPPTCTAETNDERCPPTLCFRGLPTQDLFWFCYGRSGITVLDVVLVLLFVTCRHFRFRRVISQSAPLTCVVK